MKATRFKKLYWPPMKATLFLISVCSCRGAAGSRRLFRHLVLLAAILLACGVAWSATPESASQATNDQLSVHVSGFRVDHRTGELVQAITVTNTGTRPVEGDLYVETVGLDPSMPVRSNAKRVNGGPASSAYALSKPGGAHSALKPGEQAKLILRFAPGDKPRIHYRPRVIVQEAEMQ